MDGKKAKQEDPWKAMQPIWPGGGGNNRGNQAMNAGLVEKQMQDVLGTKGFMTGSGTKDDPYKHHPGQGSAHQQMVGDVNAAWASYAYRQGRHNTIKMILDKVFG